ncbi:hypothetical protein [Microbacterium sediminis]|nr:hypothetical protein [Microbacterium sediminis]
MPATTFSCARVPTSTRSATASREGAGAAARAVATSWAAIVERARATSTR